MAVFVNVSVNEPNQNYPQLIAGEDICTGTAGENAARGALRETGQFGGFRFIDASVGYGSKAVVRNEQKFAGTRLVIPGRPCG